MWVSLFATRRGNHEGAVRTSYKLVTRLRRVGDDPARFNLPAKAPTLPNTTAVNPQAQIKHVKRYKVIRIISVILLLLAAVLIILQIMEGGKSVIQTIGAGGVWIGVGGVLFGLSLRLENKEKASGNPSDTPK
jgi:hypothetical protein